jgi:folate-binding Fe-S cluster repair protein YgfZ
MSACSNSRFAAKKVPPFSFVVTLIVALAFAATKIGGTVAFVATIMTNKYNNNNDRIVRQRQPHRQGFSLVRRYAKFTQSVGSEYLPQNPEASPGSFHIPGLRSSYPQGTPAGLRGEAVRSALVTTDRCIGWNLSTNAETSMGGLLQVSGRGTIDFLNGKLTRDFRKVRSDSNGNSYMEACLLDAKGRLIDVLRVTLDDDNRRALVLTSPGHTSADLLKRLDPFVFPIDEVVLTNFCNDNDNSDNDNRSLTFTLASTQYKHVQKAMREQSILSLSNEEMVFPGTSQSVVWKLGDVQILIVPSTGVSTAACVGYTFVFFGSGSSAATVLGKQLWEYLIGEENMEGPIEVGALEYETLRVESGQPAYGHEYGIDRLAATKRKMEQEQETENTTSNKGDGEQTKKKKKKPNDMIKTSPFELHFNPLIDLDKGCYLGQEGIASVLKNPRGSPRTLYTVVFEDDFNTYESQTRGDTSDDFDNLTTLPKPGQKLFALGSNEELQVGTLTSLGEAGGTGSRFTVGLALVKRADTIRRRMKALDLEIPRDADAFADVDLSTGSGIIQPPPMDALEGLEVIVEGTFTMGVLKAIPTRQSGMRRNSNMYDAEIEVEGIEDNESVLPSSLASTTFTSDSETEGNSESAIDMDIDTEISMDDDGTLTELQQMEVEVAQANADAEAAAAEAKRKTDKMELLKKRAEEAMARRKEKAAAARKGEEEEEPPQPQAKGEEDEDSAADEARRKAEKMAMLKQRAREAMARRKAKKK